MDIKQISCTKFEKKFDNDESISLITTGGISLGQLHDFLLGTKGWTVDRMIQLQKEEQEHAEIQKKNDCLDEDCDGS